MNKMDVIEYYSSIRNGAVSITGPGSGGQLLARSDHPLTIYSMDMSYTVSVALGIALGWPNKRVVALEGDGSMLMGLSVLTTIGRYKPENFTVVVWDNGYYLTTGTGKSQTATAFGTDLEKIGKACGIEKTYAVTDIEEMRDLLKSSLVEPGPWFLVAKVDTSDRVPRTQRDPAPVYVFESGLRFRRAALDERGMPQ